MPKALIGLGSNLGDRQQMLDEAAQQLAATAGINSTLVSRWRPTHAIGGSARQPEFLHVFPGRHFGQGSGKPTWFWGARDKSGGDHKKSIWFYFFTMILCASHRHRLIGPSYICRIREWRFGDSCLNRRPRSLRTCAIRS